MEDNLTNLVRKEDSSRVPILAIPMKRGDGTIRDGSDFEQDGRG